MTLGRRDLGTDADNTWTDGALGDAHIYSGYTYDYYFKRFNRRGLNDANLRMQSWCTRCGASDFTLYGSTFPDLLHQRRLLRRWPDGLRRRAAGRGHSTGRSWNYTSGALDIVAHEITHGVTDYTSDLIYLNESGALNESFSDIMGTAVEFFFQPAGRRARCAPIICAARTSSAGPTERHPLAGEPDRLWPSRSLLGPLHRARRRRRRAHQLGHPQPRVLPRDRGWHQPRVRVRRRRGSARPTACRSRPSSTARSRSCCRPTRPSRSARAATIQAARDLYGGGSAAERAMTQAWTAVGVN